jgi:hypothetical protein
MTLGRDGSIMAKYVERNVMSRFRSISYAPRSTEDFYGDVETSRPPLPEWTLCRNFKQLPIQDNSMLRRWTAQGRVLPDDYLVHHELDVSVQAREIAELEPMFRKVRARRLGRISLALGFSAAILLCLKPALGALLLATALVLALRCKRTPRTQSYRLYTAGEHGATLHPPRPDCISVLWPA